MSHHRLLLSASVAMAGCASPVAAPPVPAEIVVLRGPTAITTPGHRYDTLEVRLLDAQGQAVAGWSVTWSGDGEVTALTPETDQFGIARAEWTLPRTEFHAFNGATTGPSGQFTLRAEAVGFDGVPMATEARAFLADRVIEGGEFGCGFRGDGLWCWGGPWWSGPGDYIPHQIGSPDGGKVRDAAGANQVLCVTDASDLVWCSNPAVVGEFRRVAGAPPLRRLTTSDNIVPGLGKGTACGLAITDGTPWCWDPEAPTEQGAAEQLSALSMTAIDLGFLFGCGLALDGAAWCWGNNGSGQLGTGDTQASTVPRLVVGELQFVQITAGDNAACGATAEGAVWCWGASLGLGSSSVPRLIDDRPGLLGQVVVGWVSEVYVLRGNAARVWSTNYDAQLTEVYFGGLQIRQLDAGHGHACAVLLSNEVWCSSALFAGETTDLVYPEVMAPVPDPASVR